MTDSAAPRRFGLLLLAAALTIGPLACQQSTVRIEADNPEMSAYLNMVLPARIKILSWSRPISLDGDGTPDVLEVMLAAYDAFDDETKVVGNFQFELQTRRISDSIGSRVAFWSVEMTNAHTMREYLDQPTGFYRFPLKFVNGPLEPGRYLLTVWLQLPTGQRLADEYEFDYDGSSVSSPRAG